MKSVWGSGQGCEINLGLWGNGYLCFGFCCMNFQEAAQLKHLLAEQAAQQAELTRPGSVGLNHTSPFFFLTQSSSTSNYVSFVSRLPSLSNFPTRAKHGTILLVMIPFYMALPAAVRHPCLSIHSGPPHLPFNTNKQCPLPTRPYIPFNHFSRC